MKISKKSQLKLLALTALGVAALFAVDPAFASPPTTPGIGNNKGKSIGAVAGNLTDSIRGIGPLITAICYVGALTFGLIGALKWKAYGEQPDRTPLKIPITYWGIAVLLAGFPEFMGTGIVSLWGSGAELVKEPAATVKTTP